MRSVVRFLAGSARSKLRKIVVLPICHRSRPKPCQWSSESTNRRSARWFITAGDGLVNGPPEKLSSLAVDPAADFRVHHVEGQRAVPQHFIVEGAKVEFVAELLASLFSQLQNLKLTEFVRQGLARPRDVAVDFALDV